jgi:tetratricopeptide (TPR) repeat protein
MKHFCDTEQWMAAYLDGRLAQGELREYETHVAGCSRCRAELEAMRAELEEMGLGLAAREAIARRAASAGVEAGNGALTGFIARAARALRARPAALAAASSAAALLVAAFFILPRVIPSLDADLRRGEANVQRILATTDLGDLRLVGGASRPVAHTGAVRGAVAPSRTIFTQTEAALQKTLVRRPNSSVAYDRLGDLYVAEGEADRAATAYRSALLIKPDDPALLNDLAVALFRGGDLMLSREYLERASAAVDAPVEIWYNLAMVWRASGNREEMKRYLRLYLEKDPHSPWAGKARRILDE